MGLVLTAMHVRRRRQRIEWAWLLQDDLPGRVEALLVAVDVEFPVAVKVPGEVEGAEQLASCSAHSPSRVLSST